MKIEIFDYGMNAEGVGKVEGKVVLINNALVGETVEFEFVKQEKNYSTGIVKNVEKCSPNRVEPKCPYFGMCGGCDIQHMNYAEQLKFKTLLVKKTLKKVAGIDFKVEDCVPCSSVFNYRNKKLKEAGYK